MRHQIYKIAIITNDDIRSTKIFVFDDVYECVNYLNELEDQKSSGLIKDFESTHINNTMLKSMKLSDIAEYIDIPTMVKLMTACKEVFK